MPQDRLLEVHSGNRSSLHLHVPLLLDDFFGKARLLFVNQENKVPEVIEPQRLSDYFEVMTRAVFQAGVKWSQIAEHWDAYRDAFANFDAAIVATYDDLDVDRVLATPGILRMPRKVRATIANARALTETANAFGTLPQYLRSFDSYAALAKDFKKRFTFMGDMNVWYFLFRVGEAVPRFEPWVETIPGEHPRMREMVELARSAGKSREY